MQDCFATVETKHGAVLIRFAGRWKVVPRTVTGEVRESVMVDQSSLSLTGIFFSWLLKDFCFCSFLIASKPVGQWVAGNRQRSFQVLSRLGR
jgi:hypothetical protein